MSKSSITSSAYHSHRERYTGNCSWYHDDTCLTSVHTVCTSVKVSSSTGTYPQIVFTKRQLSGGQSTLFVYFQTLLNSSHVPGSTMLLRQPYKSIHSSVYFPLQLSGCALWTYNVISAVPGRRYLIFYTTSQRPFSIPDSINQYQVPGYRYAGIGTNVSVPSANSPKPGTGTWFPGNIPVLRYLVKGVLTWYQGTVQEVEACTGVMYCSHHCKLLF